MKKVILTTMFLCLTIISSSAQEVYQEIMRLSKAAAEDESKSLDVRKIATFKVEELNYMAQRTRELMPDSSVIMLDYQAYAMYEFINLFTSKLTRADKKKDRALVINTFKEATLQNPRFNDTDTGLIYSYCNNDNYLTQFSLDTDWIKALAYIREKLKGK